MAEYPQKPPFKVQMRHIHFGSQIPRLEQSTESNHPLNRTLVVPGRISLSTGTLTPLDGGHASFSFTLTSADPYALSFDHISFDHYEDWFNANGGWPGINLIIQQGTDAPLLLHDVPLNHSVYWDTGAHHWDTFSLPLNINHLNGPTSFTIIEGNSGQYGSPVIHIQNLSISGTSLSSVPEPSTYALFGLGALALVIAYRRKVA